MIFICFITAYFTNQGGHLWQFAISNCIAYDFSCFAFFREFIEVSFPYLLSSLTSFIGLFHFFALISLIIGMPDIVSLFRFTIFTTCFQHTIRTRIRMTVGVSFMLIKIMNIFHYSTSRTSLFHYITLSLKSLGFLSVCVTKRIAEAISNTGFLILVRINRPLGDNRILS